MKVKSMRGKMVDFTSFYMANDKVAAIGNGRMNTRGDIIDSRGNVKKSREEFAREYYNTPNAVKNVSLKDMIATEELMTPADAWNAAVEKKTSARKKLSD